MHYSRRLWRRRGRTWRDVAVVLLFGAMAASTLGLIGIGKGNYPVLDDHWPAGSVDVANLKTRIGWWDGPPYGSGERCLMYRGDIDSLQQAIDGFAKIKAPRLQLVIHDGGPADSEFLKNSDDPKADLHYDWSFTVWNARSWNQLYNNPASQLSAGSERFRESVAPPMLDVCVGGEKGIDFSKVKVPKGVSTTDERADANGFTGGSVVVGDVYDTMTSKPVTGATVAISHEKAFEQWDQNASCTTDADGHFELKTELGGSFGVIASADGYATRVLGRVHLRGNTFRRFAAYLTPETTLTGIAIDTDGKPVVGATIHSESVTGLDGRGYILPEQRQTRSDAQGKFKLTGLPQGFAQVWINGKHYFQLDILKLHAIPEDDLVIQLTATGQVKGRVLDKVGTPAAHGCVDIEPAVAQRDRIGKWGGSSNTAADGSFHFEDVPPGEYIVTAMATNPGSALTGSDPSAKTIQVKASESVLVEVTGR